MGAAFRKDLLADGLAVEAVEQQVGRSQARILQAPAVVVLCLTMAEMDHYSDRRRQRAEFRMALQSVALVGGQLLLAAHGEGLGGVWVCAPLFAPQAVAEALLLPADWEPQGMLLLGYPESVPSARPRKSLDDIILFIDG
jgi:coenzyme F420-0:L-glutamate ligase/coenzyme F420-1:gamma-L-glutamate ligase